MSEHRELFNENNIENSELAALLRHASCGICAYKVEPGEKTVMLYMTDGFCDICDGSKEEIAKAYVADRLFGVHKDYQEAMNDICARAISMGIEQEITYKAVTLKGDYKWCTLKLSPDKRSDGTIMLYATFFDVNKEEIIQRNLRDLIHNVPSAICLFHYDGKILEPIIISDRYSEMIGTDGYEDFKKTEDMNFRHVHPDDLDRVKQIVIDALTKTFKLDCTFRSLNEATGVYRWLNMQAKVVVQEDGTSYSYVAYTDITRDKDSEQKLREDELILEAATRNAGVWYWNCHWKDNIAYVGKRFQKDFAVPSEMSGFCEEMIKRNIVDKDYGDDFRHMCQEIMAGKVESECIVKGYFADGTSHWMKFKLTNIFNEDNVIQEAVGIMQLVDDMKDMELKYEIERRHSEEDKDLISHACINVSTWEVVSYEGAFKNCGNGIISIDDLSRNIISEITDEDVKNSILKMHNRQYLLKEFAEGNTEISFEYQRTIAEGKCIWVHSTFHMVNDHNGTEIMMFEYCYDINIKKTMNILTEFAVNDDYDLMGFVNMYDRKAIMIYGKSSYNPKDEAILEDDYQTSLLDFAANAVIKEDRVRYLKMADLNNVATYLEKHDNLEFYFSMKNSENKVRAKKVRYMKYKQDDNCIIFIQSDITQLIAEQKKNQEALEMALKEAKVASSAKTSFLSQMSHEIRTPMNAIIGMTKLAEQTMDSIELEHYLNQIDASSQYLLGIINDILDMSRIESGKLELHPQWTDSDKIILECVEMLDSAMKNKHINFVYPERNKENHIRFFIDPMRLQQIYMNLLNNSIKFTPEGGTIELVVQNIPNTKNTGIIRSQVRDSGCGMSQDFLTRIFSPFEMEENIFSSTVQGTGLGLALVKSFITKMGGKIWVDSKLGEGSIFTFEIPYESKTVDVEVEEKLHPYNVTLDGINILLVDDHPLNREIAKKILENKGANVETAVDGYDACNVFAESADGHYDAILMDVRMPKMNGLEATKKIRHMNKAKAATIPIIAMTANAFDEDVNMSIEAGMNAHLAKPIEPDILLEALEKYIRK